MFPSDLPSLEKVGNASAATVGPKAAAKGGLTFGERAVLSTLGGNGAKVEHVALVPLCQSFRSACSGPESLVSDDGPCFAAPA